MKWYWFVLLLVAAVVVVIVIEPYARRHPAPGAPSAPVVEEKKPEPRLKQVAKDGGGDWYINSYVFEDRRTGVEIACFTYNGHISCVKL